MGLERRQHTLGRGRQRSVVEGEHHLVVVERETGVVLHGTDTRQRRRIDRDGPAGPDGVRMARARLGRGLADHAG